MPVYMVYVCHSVSDRAQLEKYWASMHWYMAPFMQVSAPTRLHSCA
jgi:hypothetical protein